MAPRWGATQCQCLRWITTGRHPLVTHARFLLFLFFSVGQVVNIKAKVNRAFNSSMEVGEPPPRCRPPPLPLSPSLCARPCQPCAPIHRGQMSNTQILPRFPDLILLVGPLLLRLVGCGCPGSRAGSQGCCTLSQVGIQVSYEDLCSGKHCSICKAYATFVAQGSSGSKVSGGRGLRGLGGSLCRGSEEMASLGRDGLGWAWLSITACAVASWLSAHIWVGDPLSREWGARWGAEALSPAQSTEGTCPLLPSPHLCPGRAGT